jgi:hypothetical protein
VSTTGDVEGTFKAALNEVRVKAATCEYDIPTPTDTILDFNRVNVEYRQGGNVEVLSFVENASACDSAVNADSSWYYDDPAAPSRIVLCTDTCERVRTEIGGKIEILYGCATRVP